MIDCDWPWWIMFAAAMVSSYFREMRLHTERNDPRCTLFYTYQPAALKNGSPLAPSGQIHFKDIFACQFLSVTHYVVGSVLNTGLACSIQIDTRDHNSTWHCQHQPDSHSCHLALPGHSPKPPTGSHRRLAQPKNPH